MMEQVARSRLDDARKFLLLNPIETYFKLAGESSRSSRVCYRENGFGR